MVPGRSGGAAEAPRKMALPTEMKIGSLWDPNGVPRLWTEIEGRFKAGDPDIRSWVSKTLEAADQWSARPDSYYLALFRPDTPFGASTICCPFHPEESGWVPFQWDPDHPWRLTCPRCAQEGRKPDSYPNDLYPDEGRGCRPTDEAWRKTHDAAWSRKYGIPWEKWDGHTHGHIDSFAFFFLGHCQKRIFFELTWRRQMLSTLCRGYLFASRLYPKDSPERKRADTYGHKAKLIMVTMTRAILGDPYLQDVLEMEPESYRRAVQSLATDADGKPLPCGEYPGYRERDTISDHSADDPEHPVEKIKIGWWKKALTIFPSNASSECAGAWLPCYAMIQGSFSPVEREARLSELVDRLFVAKEEDEPRRKAKGRAVKAGIADIGLRPYEFTMKGNLDGGAAMANLNLGLMLDDRQIVRNVAAAIRRYLDGGYFTSDGLGCETSPHYTQVALANLESPLVALNGMKAGFGPGDSFWDPESESINPYLDPALGAAAYGPLLSVLPDGLCAPWCDSWVTERPNLGLAEKVANATGKVPERFLPWLDVSRDAAGKVRLQLRKDPALPSYVLPVNGLAVMRAGVGPDQTFVSVDWSKATGHSHDGPFNLLVYGARHEVLFDQGYLNNVTPTQAWMNSAEAHNTALVRMADGSAEQCVTWRGGLRFFADTPTVKAVEVAEEDAAKLKRGSLADQSTAYQRSVLLVETESPAAAYVVDIFRLRGGTTHDYYVHGLGDDFALSGAELKPVADPKLSLYDTSGFTYKTDTGARAITSISRSTAEGPFAAAWRNMKDWRTAPPGRDEDAEITVRMLGVPGTEIFVGTAAGQRYIDARDVAQRVTVLCVRRKAVAFRDAPDAFVAVIDARRQQAELIRQVDRLEVVSGDGAGVGLRVVHSSGADYVLSTTQDAAPTVFFDPHTARKFTLTGRLGVVRTWPGKPAAALLLKGEQLTGGERKE